MFAKTLITAAFLALAVSASPVSSRQSPSQVVSSGGPSGGSFSGSSGGSYSANPGVVSSLSPISFNNWGGFSSLQNFDNFYGLNNFGGNQNQQTVIQQTVVCQPISEISFVQQYLSVLQEFAKRIITEQVCQVETQTIVWSQFVSNLQSFSGDFRRQSGRQIGFDQSTANHIGSLVDSSGNLCTSDLGIKGSSIGGNLIHVSGDNWVTGQSEQSVQQAYLSSQVNVLQSSGLGANNGFNSLGQAQPVGSF